MALFWRNIDAPDFGRAMDGYRGFTNTFNDAINNLDRGLARYDGAKDDAANTRLLAEFAGFNDPNAARARLAALTADPNFARYNASTIGAVSGRPGQLLNEALAGVNLEASKDNLANNREDRATDKRLGAMLPEYLTSPDQAAYLKAHQGDFSGIGSRTLGAFIGSGQDYVRNNEQILSSRQGRQFAAQDQQWKADDREQQDGIDAATAEFRRYDDPLQAEAAVRQKFGAVVATKALGQLGVFGGGGLSAGSALSNTILSAGGGSGGVDPARAITGGGAGNLGIGVLPDNIKTVGDVSRFQQLLNDRGQESSATGIYQIVGQTLRGKNGVNGYAERALGKNWQNVEWTPAVQDKIAQAIYEDHKGSNASLRQQWTSLKNVSDAVLNAARARGWVAMRDVISAGETRSRASDLLAASATQALTDRTLSRGVNAARSNLNPDNYISKISAARQSEVDMAGAIANIRKNPRFKDYTDERLAEEVNRVVAAGAAMNKTGRGGISLNVASQIIASNPDYNNYSLWNGGALNLIGAAARGGRSVGDRSGIDRRIKEYMNGTFDQQASANDDLDVAVASRAQASKLNEAAMAAAQRVQNAQRAGRIVNPSDVALAAQVTNSMVSQATDAIASRIPRGDQTVDPNARRASARSASVPVRVAGPPAAGSLAALGSDALSQARAIRKMPEGPNRIRLADQFQRTYDGMSPSQSIVAHYRQMGLEAQKAAILGGIAGQQLRENFRKKYGMDPERAIRIANTK